MRASIGILTRVFLKIHVQCLNCTALLDWLQQMEADTTNQAPDSSVRGSSTHGLAISTE